MICCWKVKEIRSHKYNILKEASTMGGLTTEHLRKTLFSLANADTSRAVKTLQVDDSYCISIIHDVETLS